MLKMLRGWLCLLRLSNSVRDNSTVRLVVEGLLAKDFAAEDTMAEERELL